MRLGIGERWAKKKKMGEKWAPKNGAHNFFLKKMGDPKKKKDGLKNGLRKFKIEFLKKLKEMCSGAKNITRLSPLGVPKKKRWAVDGQFARICPQNKNEEDGLPKKKKVGKRPSF